MPPLPRISVITPSYQQAPFLAATLRSVACQEYPNTEHLVVDGGSTDGSIDIIRRHEASLAWWCSEKDAGQADAINKGLRRATGEIVTWLNSDDLLLPGALHRIARAYRDARVMATCGWNVSIDLQGRVIHRRVYPQPTARVLTHRPLLPQETVFWRRELLDTLGYLDPTLHFRMDMDLWVRMANAAIVPRLIPAYLSAFRRHPDQKNEAMATQGDPDLQRIIEREHGPGITLKALRRRIPRHWKLRHRFLKFRARAGWPRVPWWDPVHQLQVPPVGEAEPG